MRFLPSVVPTKSLLIVLAIVTATAIGVAAMVAGEFDDAPGLVLLGLVWLLGTVALGTRSVSRRH